MRDLNYQLKQLCARNRDGSYSTQAGRHRALQLIAKQLDKAGFRKMTVQSLKPKHVEALVKQWQVEGLNPGTIKNRLSAIRWWAEKIDKPAIVARSNDHYGIDRRCFVSKQSKAVDLTAQQLNKITDPSVRISLELQKAFGLRREEALKFSPAYADKGDHIRLKASWTKGGKQREIIIRNEEQRAVLQRAHRLAGNGSLIPADRTYIQQLKIYERQTLKAGLSKLHGLRHLYAQQRYQELTGWLAPAAGGKTSKALSRQEKGQDRSARLQISKELGHNREQVVTIYLGR